jgi:hypothetical protein
MIGSKKLPNALGIDGIMKSHTMTTPCSVKNRLYSIELKNQLLGFKSSHRMSSAKVPPIASMTEFATKKRMPMRLWSRVMSQERTVRWAVM